MIYTRVICCLLVVSAQCAETTTTEMVLEELAHYQEQSIGDVRIRQRTLCGGDREIEMSLAGARGQYTYQVSSLRELLLGLVEYTFEWQSSPFFAPQNWIISFLKCGETVEDVCGKGVFLDDYLHVTYPARNEKNPIYRFTLNIPGKSLKPYQISSEECEQMGNRAKKLSLLPTGEKRHKAPIFKKQNLAEELEFHEVTHDEFYDFMEEYDV